MTELIFRCDICLKTFVNEFDLNCHSLFDEGKLREFCSTDKTDYAKLNEEQYLKEYNSRPEVKERRKEYYSIYTKL